MSPIILSKKSKILLKSTVIQMLPPLAIKKHCASLSHSFFHLGIEFKLKDLFVKFQEKYKNASQNKLGQKHFLQAPCLRKAKKVCCRFASASDLSSIEIDNETVSSISNQVRCGISAWVKCNLM